jgi:glucose/arabinose dehydrogenase
MKMRALVGLLSLSCLSLVGCEEGGEATDQPADAAKPAEQPAAEPAKPEPTPQEACTQLAAAAKAADEAKVTSMLAPGGAEALAAEGAKEAVMATWAQATCGEAKVEGDKATVSITAGTETKEATFVKAEGAWKFDLAAYLAKYPVDMGKGKKGKKAKKGAKAKKAKG